MSHIFISYSSQNIAEREKLYHFLRSEGFEDDEIWWDKERIKPGDDWRDEIDYALKDSYIVIVIVSQESMGSVYVTYEWSWALGNGIPVIPVKFVKDVPNLHLRLAKSTQ